MAHSELKASVVDDRANRHDVSLSLIKSLCSVYPCDFGSVGAIQCLLGAGLMPQLYKRYVDDTLARMPSADVATEFLSTLNGLHPSLTFTMELSVDNKIPFIGIEIVKNGTKLETQVYRKPTNNGLVSTCIFFLVHVDYSSKSRSCVQSFDSFKANEIELNVANFEIARLCGSFSKEKYYRMENFGENC